MAVLAFLLLIAALLLFLASTRQWALWIRGCVWGGGVLLLLMAWLLLGSSERDPELRIALGDFFSKLDRPGESMLVRMFASNGATVAHIVLSLFDIFLFLALIVSIVALIAFGPGEKLDRAIRPVMAGVIGAIVGGLIALAIVGTGFGEREKRTAYAGPVRLETVNAGDLVLLNGDLLRLHGVLAPRPGQICRHGPRTQDCGAESERALERMVDGAFLMCALDQTATPDRPQGGPNRIANCTAVRNGGEQFDVGRRMVEEGFAISVNGAYDDEQREAQLMSRGLMTWCMVRPFAWVRMTQAQRDAFAKSGVYPPGTETVGACPPPHGGPYNRTPETTAPN